MNEKTKRSNDISNETESSNWLSVIPMREFNYLLNKQQFGTPSDYDMVGPIPNFPLVATVEKASMFNSPCHARRENSLLCDTTK